MTPEGRAAPSPERHGERLTGEAGPLGTVDPDGREAVTHRAPVAATAMVLVGLAGLIVSLVVLGSIAEGVRDQEVFALDTWATPFLHGISSPALDALMNMFTTLGSSLVIVPLFIVAVASLVSKRRYGTGLFLAVASGGALVLNASMKLFFERPRPQLTYAKVLPDYSFPSGHTMNGIVFYIALALVVWSVLGRRAGVAATTVAVALALAIGVSRIYLGYHYLTDVVGGIVAGIAWLIVAGAAFRARPAWWRWGTVAPGRPDGRDSVDPVVPR